MSKVMITGIGMLTAVGNGREASWEAIKAGKPGIGRITTFDASRCTSQVAAEVKGFEEWAIGGGLLDRKAARHMARFSQYAVATAKEAWADAGFTDEAKPDMDRVATIFGVGIGGLEVTGESFKTLFEKGPERLSPLAIPELIANEGAGNVAIALGAKGPCQVVTTACASSTDALGFALDLIRAGRADVVVAGGSEAVMKARGAKVYAELAGYGATCDAYHITAPDPSADGAVKAIEIALRDAGVTDKSTVGYINAHGTSTHLNDQMETSAFKRVFGEEGAKKINISSTKPCHGHCLGATGAIEAAITALAVKEGFAPPTINYEKPDLEVDASKGETPLDLNYTPNVGVSRDIEVALSSSLGFGGHNGILVFRKA